MVLSLENPLLATRRCVRFSTKNKAVGVGGGGEEVVESRFYPCSYTTYQYKRSI